MLSEHNELRKRPPLPANRLARLESASPAAGRPVRMSSLQRLRYSSATMSKLTLPCPRSTHC